MHVYNGCHARSLKNPTSTRRKAVWVPSATGAPTSGVWMLSGGGGPAVVVVVDCRSSSSRRETCVASPVEVINFCFVWRSQVVFSGFCGGIARGLVEGPFEYIKVCRQLEKPWVLREVYNGSGATIFRNAFLFSFFVVYVLLLPNREGHAHANAHFPLPLLLLLLLLLLLQPFVVNAANKPDSYLAMRRHLNLLRAASSDTST